MTEENPTTGGAASASGSLDLGAILGGPFRDPRALPKFLGGCLAVIGIAFFGLGLLALAGYLFQTAERARRGEEHPMPEWSDIAQLLGDGLRVWAVILGYLAPVAVLAIVVAVLGFIPVLGGLANVVLGPLTFLLGLLGYLLLPPALARMIASGEIRSAFAVQDNLRSIQNHLGTYAVFILIVIMIEVLSTASAALCGIGLIPGVFWAQAAGGAALGRMARAMDI
jgi:hypothetical protein